MLVKITGIHPADAYADLNVVGKMFAAISIEPSHLDGYYTIQCSNNRMFLAVKFTPVNRKRRLLILVGILFVLILALVTTQVDAGETKIQLHTISYHVDRGTDWNEKNWGVGIRQYTEDKYFTVGVYKNSEYNTSYYGGIGYEWSVYKRLKLGLIAGVVTGYNDIDPAPLLVPVITYERMNLTVVPYPEAVVLLSFDVVI